MSSGATKDCPYCQQKIPAAATVCPSCSRWVQTDAPDVPAAASVPADTGFFGGDVLRSLEEKEKLNTLRLQLAGVGLLVLCAVLAGGVWFFGSLPARQAEEQVTQEAIRWARTETARVIELRGPRLTQEALATEKALATQAAEGPQTILRRGKDLPVVLQDDFGVNANGWYTGTDEDELISGNWVIEDSKYRISLEAKDAFTQWMWPTIEGTLPENFYLGLRLDFEEGVERSDGGMIFRLQEDGSFYLFDLYLDGSYAIYYHLTDSWETIIEGEITNAYRPGIANLLEVVGEGSHYTYFLNDINLGAFDHEALTGGGVGVCVGLPNPGDVGVWLFDDFDLRFSSATK